MDASSSNQTLGVNAVISATMPAAMPSAASAWAEKFHRIVQGRIGMVPGDIYHLWHGELLDRQYLPRHAILTQHDFNPYQDIAIDEHGCWRWNSNKPELHQAVRAYFQGRQEDGRQG